MKESFGFVISFVLVLLTMGFCQDPVAAGQDNRNVLTAKSNSFDECGVANSLIDDTNNSRLDYGEETAPNEFPWQAYIVAASTEGGNSLYYRSCGGSLIDDRWILTSPGCGYYQDSTVIKVVLGAHDLSAKTEDNRQVFKVLDVFTHPSEAIPSDRPITLLRLSSAVTYTKYIRPVCLPSWDDPDFANETVVVTGWTPSDESVLLKETAQVEPVCLSAYFNNHTICTRPLDNNSGDPMNFQMPDGRWKQIGLYYTMMTAFGSTSSAYTRISFYSSWINDTIAAHPSNSAAASSVNKTITPIVVLLAFLLLFISLN